jgi:hypothetical protein
VNLLKLTKSLSRMAIGENAGFAERFSSGRQKQRVTATTATVDFVKGTTELLKVAESVCVLVATKRPKASNFPNA